MTFLFIVGSVFMTYDDRLDVLSGSLARLLSPKLRYEAHEYDTLDGPYDVYDPRTGRTMPLFDAACVEFLSASVVSVGRDGVTAARRQEAAKDFRSLGSVVFSAEGFLRDSGRDSVRRDDGRSAFCVEALSAWQGLTHWPGDGTGLGFERAVAANDAMQMELLAYIADGCRFYGAYCDGTDGAEMSAALSDYTESARTLAYHALRDAGRDYAGVDFNVASDMRRALARVADGGGARYVCSSDFRENVPPALLLRDFGIPMPDGFPDVQLSAEKPGVYGFEADMLPKPSGPAWEPESGRDTSDLDAAFGGIGYVPDVQNDIEVYL